MNTPSWILAMLAVGTLFYLWGPHADDEQARESEESEAKQCFIADENHNMRCHMYDQHMGMIDYVGRWSIVFNRRRCHPDLRYVRCFNSDKETVLPSGISSDVCAIDERGNQITARELLTMKVQHD